MSRLPPQEGERIDRSRPLSFTFDGRTVQGYGGDTIASALYAGGQRTFSRSFKYHRPRGELCGCGQCANSLVDVDGRPGIRACGEPAVDGMRVRHQNAWPSLRFDVMRATDRIGGPFTQVGFYYKTFIRPRRLWPVYEKVLRHAAGLGRLRARQDEREWTTEYRRRHCDVLVVGGGIAGLTAAITAAEAGLDVVLCDEDAAPGGLLLAEGRHDQARDLAERARAAGVELLAGASALGHFEGLVAVWQRSTLHQIRAARHVIATGAIQQPLVFHDNDLPGVMLSGGARRLAALYAVKPGERAVVATADDRGLDDALALKAAGVDIRAVADLRATSEVAGRTAELRAAGIDVMHSATVVRAHGRDQVRAATLARVDRHGRATAGTLTRVPCDLVAVSGGAHPALSLLLQAGGQAAYDPRRPATASRTCRRGCTSPVSSPGPTIWRPRSSPGGRPGWRRRAGRRKRPVPAGSVTSSPRCRRARPTADGEGRASSTSTRTSRPRTSRTRRPRAMTRSSCPSATRPRRWGRRRGASPRSPSRGRSPRRRAPTLGAVGLTTARPPWATVPLGVLAGRPFEPAKRSALHDEHRALGADVRWAGDWRRAYHYGDPQAEVLAVQRHAGLIDVSTLGKLLVSGPDAGELLDRLYTEPDVQPGDRSHPLRRHGVRGRPHHG